MQRLPKVVKNNRKNSEVKNSSSVENVMQRKISNNKDYEQKVDNEKLINYDIYHESAKIKLQQCIKMNPKKGQYKNKKS